MISIESLHKHIPEEWLQIIDETELKKDYWRIIVDEINKVGIMLQPNYKDIFKVFELCSPNKIKCVLLGQDPYIKGEAHGLSFSVKNGFNIPPSLRRIFEEIQLEYGEELFKIPRTGNLSRWCDDGVFLLNTILTTIKDKSNAHKDIGWKYFTTHVLEQLIKLNSKIVFIALGAQASRLCREIGCENLICVGHPSPLNTSIPFKGTNVFKQANELLIKNDMLPIRWFHL